MGIQDVIEGKKRWRAHMARVKALPPDYRIVYKQIQRYLFKVGPADMPDGRLLSGIVDFFQEGAAAGKGVREILGNDVAAFCDNLVTVAPGRTGTDRGTRAGRETGNGDTAGPPHPAAGEGRGGQARAGCRVRRH